MPDKAVLFGPFVGELYWEAGRFAPLLPYYKFKKFKNQDIKFIVLTREERFDLYGRYADILVPLKIPGDYIDKSPNCFKLDGLKNYEYIELAKKFKEKYSKRYKIIEHLYPDAQKRYYTNKNQFPRNQMIYDYKPRKQNYKLVDSYLPNDKPIVVLAPRYRNGFKRNWNRWPEFYDMVWNHDALKSDFNFIICGKPGEYVPDEKKRFYDINDIKLGESSSLVGLLLVVLERTFFTFGSQSAIPNLSLLYGVEVLEFGCQKKLHTVTYNVKNTPITFIEDMKYKIDTKTIFTHFNKLIYKKLSKNK